MIYSYTPPIKRQGENFSFRIVFFQYFRNEVRKYCLIKKFALQTLNAEKRRYVRRFLASPPIKRQGENFSFQIAFFQYLLIKIPLAAQ